MTFWLLIRRSLRFHARSHFGVLLGAAIGSAALVGALVVGDSVKGSLRQHALDRLQGIQFAMNTGDRFFQQNLDERMGTNEIHSVQLGDKHNSARIGEFGNGRTAVLQLSGTAARQDGSARANQVSVLGIDPAAWGQLLQTGLVSAAESRTEVARNLFSTAGVPPEAQAAWESGDAVLINQTLAQQLKAHTGDEILLRIPKPSSLARDAVITPREGTSMALRLKIAGILDERLLGGFSLAANQTPAANAFLDLSFLAPKLDLGQRANLLLSSEFQGGDVSKGLSWLKSRLQSSFSLEDAQLSVHSIEQPQSKTGGEYVPPCVEISSARIFLESNVVSGALTQRQRLLVWHNGFEGDNTNDLALSQFVTNGTRILTYLANLIGKEDRTTPYSMITATDGAWVPNDMRDEEILINEWLAEDLQAKPGDILQVSYYVVDSASRLTERTNSFKVRSIVALKGRYADRTLMPEFPGVAKAESTQDWDTGFPLVYKIRDKDEAYWRRYRGTPKAFITLAAGQAMWANRFGSLTAIRYEVPTNSSAQTYRDHAYKNLLANLNPAEFGFRFLPVREQALQAANQSQDFGQLFIGFSVFLVVAALLLMGILFQFGLEQRRTEVGTLLALGLRPRQVRQLLLGEGVMLALFGSLLGVGLGLAYAKAMLWGLTTVWRNAIGNSVLHFFSSGTSLLIGFFAGTVVAAFTIWLTLRNQTRQPARALLADEPPRSKSGTGRVARWIAFLSGFISLATVGYALSTRQTTNPEIFFEAGSLLLVAGLAWASVWLAGAANNQSSAADLSVAGLAVRGCARRRKRSLATIALLACGCFIIVSIGVFRLDANQDASKHSSGTGGFALIGRAALPIVQDLNTESGRQFFGLSDKDFDHVTIVPFRVHNGDEASCLNLNRAQRPRLLGVKPDLLIGRFTFAEVAKGLDIHNGWHLLRRAVTGSTALPDEIPAIGDANSIQWALGKSVGDTLDYTDERGRTFKLRLVGAVANSILQGSLIIDEAEFVKQFPSASGYRFFLMDAPSAAINQISATLSRALQDQGLELTPAVQRLDEFNAVQNTYLGTFQILGGLGLLLGSAGLGVVVLRNVLERRGELALLMAVGFRKQALHWIVLVEHGALLGLGLALGIIAAVIAVLPALFSPARQLPFGSLGVTLAAVLLNGLIWTWLATRVALRGNLLAALRNE